MYPIEVSLLWFLSDKKKILERMQIIRDTIKLYIKMLSKAGGF